MSLVQITCTNLTGQYHFCVRWFASRCDGRYGRGRKGVGVEIELTVPVGVGVGVEGRGVPTGVEVGSGRGVEVASVSNVDVGSGVEVASPPPPQASANRSDVAINPMRILAGKTVSSSFPYSGLLRQWLTLAD